MQDSSNKSELSRILEMGSPVSTSGSRKWAWLATSAAILAIGFLLMRGISSTDQTPRYQFAKVERGGLTITVTATGALQPTNQVDVGSELSGIVKSVEADFNDRVEVGQVLLRLDATRLEAQVLQSDAALSASRAKEREAAASEDELRRKHARTRELFERGFVSEEALIASSAALERASAALQSTVSQVAQAKAALDVDRTNLSKTIVRSPTKGTVLSRKVEPGQTVAATLQAPILFTLAEDLTKMELHVDVDEADVGRVSSGMEATFTVDAYPGREFPSSVAEVRNAAKTVSGVVTYETILAVDNSKLLLRPGMTGTAVVTVHRIADALLVPNAALRFSPPAPGAQVQRTLASRLLPSPPRAVPRTARTIGDRPHQQVWVMRDGIPAPIPVTVGLTDGHMTQIVNGDLKPGVELLTDAAATSK